MQRHAPTTILRSDKDEYLLILREMLRSIDSREPPFNGTYPMFNKFVSSVGQRKIERCILEAIDFDLQISVLDTGCVSLETLKRLDPIKATRYNFPGIYLHLIWDTTLSNVYWLYVGASHHVASRIRHHIVRKYSTKSLHNKVWKMPHRNDRWILLAGCRDLGLEAAHEPPVLSLLEMLFALRLRTLPSTTLKCFLGQGFAVPDISEHLNVAIPLFQAYPGCQEYNGGLAEAILGFSFPRLYKTCRYDPRRQFNCMDQMP
jgi:hypothetical protein